MGESDPEMAATALQRRFENAVAKNRDLYRMACFGKLYKAWTCYVMNMSRCKLLRIIIFRNEAVRTFIYRRS